MVKIPYIFTIDDVYYEITSYLSFEDKIVISKELQRNCLRTYNFNDRCFRYKNIDDLFSLYTEAIDCEYFDYICELQIIFKDELSDYYNKICGYTRADFAYDYYNNLSRFTDSVLSDLFDETYITVYTRKIIEYFENNNLQVTLSNHTIFELEDKIGIDIHQSVIEYYKYALENKNIELFCVRCGLFGHHSASSECIFYNIYYQNKVTKQTVRNTIDFMIDKIIDDDNTARKFLEILPFLCVSCKKHTKNTKCSNYCCGNCCNGCIVHK